MKDTCRSCKNEYIKSYNWNMSYCPSCIVDELENKTNLEWIPPMDPSISSHTSFDFIRNEDLFVIVKNNKGYYIVNNVNYYLRPRKYGKVFYKNIIEKCLEWIKKKQQ